MTELEKLEKDRREAKNVLDYMLTKRTEILKATDKAEMELASIDRQIATLKGTRSEY